MRGKVDLIPADALLSPSLSDGDPRAPDLRRLWCVFVRRRPVILGAVVVTMALVSVWLIQTKPTYTATTELLIDPRRERVLKDEAVISDLVLDASTIATEVSLVRSFSVAKRVVERLELEAHPRFGAAPPPFSLLGWLEDIVSQISGDGDGETGADGATTPSGSAEEGYDVAPAVETSIAMVQDGTAVHRVGATYFIEISYSDSDPEMAARLANAVAEAYLVEQLEARYQAAQRAASWLSERVGTVREKLETSERALSAHRAAHHLVKAQSGTLAEQQAAEISTQLVAARAQAVDKKSKFDQAQRILEGGAGIESVAGVMDAPVIAGLRGQDADLARQEADQLTRYGPEHPSIVKIRAERRDLKRQIEREVGRVVQTLKTDYEFALRKEQSLEASMQELTGADKNDQAVIRLRELERDAQSNRALYESLLTRFKEAEQQTSLQSAESRIVAPALRPRLPSFPNKQKFVILALFVGFAIGAGIAFLLERIEDGFTTIEQVEEVLHLPVVAMVPHLTARERMIDGRAASIPDYVALNPLSRFGESIRSVRVSTQMSNIDSPPRLVLVTSAIPSEGKTTMVLSLAASATAANQRVLVVDCDLRHPSTTKHFNMHEGPGLTDLLIGQVPPERVFLRGPASGLTVLPAGTTARHPPDILGSERLRSLIATLRQGYDAVFIDGPPLSPVIDSSLLSKLVDKVVLVVHWRTTPRDIVLRAVQSIDNPRQKIAGIVINNTQLRWVSSYAPYYDYYYRKYQNYYAS